MNLEEISKKITTMKQERDQLTGRLDQLKEQLKKLGINSIKEGRDRLETLREEITAEEIAIEENKRTIRKHLEGAYVE